MQVGHERKKSHYIFSLPLKPCEIRWRQAVSNQGEKEV
jgi:hypothetical protein